MAIPVPPHLVHHPDLDRRYPPTTEIPTVHFSAEQCREHAAALGLSKWSREDREGVGDGRCGYVPEEQARTRCRVGGGAAWESRARGMDVIVWRGDAGG